MLTILPPMSAIIILMSWGLPVRTGSAASFWKLRRQVFSVRQAQNTASRVEGFALRDLWDFCRLSQGQILDQNCCVWSPMREEVDLERMIDRVAICGGSGQSFIQRLAATRERRSAIFTGDIYYHTAWWWTEAFWRWSWTPYRGSFTEN